jgi:hypothetical protein
MEKRKAKNCYLWLWLSPLAIAPTVFLLYNWVDAVSYPISTAISQVLLGSALSDQSPIASLLYSALAALFGQWLTVLNFP